MKFLNYDKVLCLSPHPDDVEYGMLGTIMKYKDTQFDIVVLSQGGDFDITTKTERQNECRKVWENIDNIEGHFIEDSKFIKNKDEDEWVNILENKFDISSYDCIITTSPSDSHFEHRVVSGFTHALVRRSKCGIIQYKSPSTLDTWIPNLFVDLMMLANRDKKDGHSQSTHALFSAFLWFIKINKLKLFESQQDKSYFSEESLKSFHSNYQCSMRDMNYVESFKIVRGYN
jgi:LmbE family N-acetylglucosaminyl deacetylase